VARRFGLRQAVGCAIVLLASAGATVAFIVHQLSQATGALGQTHAIKGLDTGALAPAGFGAPQTLLLVGNDERKHTTTQPVLPHSNEMLLVRFDPGKPWISMMSIPRELEVTIYPKGQQPTTTRFNYAYTAGGIPLLVSTIKRVLKLSVNHVVVIDFNQFKAAIDDIGCVYATVDRRYFHVNTPTSDQYQEINLQPGYQDMCGSDALQFVSYRHGDTSLVRDARDQSFLLSAKQQYGPTLLDNTAKFERIFGRTVQTDPGLHTNTGLLDLVGTLISSAGDPVRQVKFQVNLNPVGANPCECVTATRQQIDSSVHSFLYGRAPSQARTATAAPVVKSPAALSRLQLSPTPALELADAQTAASKLAFPLELPRVQAAGGIGQSGFDVRDYLIHGPGGDPYEIYAAVFPTGQLGQYYDVQGTTWKAAPLFAGAGQIVDAGGRNYHLYYTGSHLQVIAWYEHGAVYWIRNTLTDGLQNRDLLVLAERTIPTLSPSLRSSGRAPTPKLPPALAARLKAAAKPPPVRSSGTLGAIGGLLAIVAAPLLAIALLWRRRRWRGLGDRLASASERIDLTHAAAARIAPSDWCPPPSAGEPLSSARRDADRHQPAVRS
jgi:polyisoprenyl-teichoic acid--peptidoglycan teichoic acid transferase